MWTISPWLQLSACDFQKLWTDLIENDTSGLMSDLHVSTIACNSCELLQQIQKRNEHLKIHLCAGDLIFSFPDEFFKSLVSLDMRMQSYPRVLQEGCGGKNT